MKTGRVLNLLMIAALFLGGFPVGKVAANNNLEGNIWTRLGINGQDILALTIAPPLSGGDPAMPTTLYVGTRNSGGFKSVNSGEIWSPINTNWTTADIRSLTIDPKTPTTLYAGIWGNGVFKSTNSGETWSAINTGLTNLSIQAIVIDPVIPTTLYVAANAYVGGSIFKSTDGGEHWSASSTGLTNTEITALKIDPITPSTLYVVTWGGGVFKSTDSGGSWKKANTGLPATSGIYLAIDPKTPTTLYVETWDSGIFKSINAGETWSAINTGMPTSVVYTMAIDPKTPTTLYVGTPNNGIFKSTDGGGNWNPLNTGLPATWIYSLAVDPVTPTTLYAGTADGVFIMVSPPGSFAKISPANAAAGVTINPTLTWGTSSGATSYEYCYDTTNDNTCGTTWISTATNTSVALSGLSNNTTYYWQVRATNASGTTYANDNTWWNFTTVPATNVTLSIYPAVKSVVLGQNFDLGIEVQAGTLAVDGAAAYLNFNPSYLQVISISAESNLTTVLQNTFDNTSGQINFVAGSLSNFPTGTFTLATVTLKALAPISATPITFFTAAPRKSEVTFGGNSVLNSTTPGSVEITNTATINGGVTLQGRPALPNARWSIPLNISLTLPGSSLPAYTFTPTTDNSGKFTLTGIVPGTYDIRVKHSHTLQNLKTVALTAGVNTIDFGILLEGDANNDNAVTLIDFSILATSFSKCQGTSGYDSRADFNLDACVTLLDFSLLATHFGKSGATLTVDPFEGVAPIHQTQAGVTIFVEPAMSQTQVGKTFTIILRVQIDSGMVDGAQASLDFDPTKLRAKKVTANTTLLPQVLLNEYNNTTGTVDYAAGTFSNFPTGSINLAQIEFEALAKTTTTSITFHHGALRNTEITFAGDSILTSEVDGAISIADLYKVFLSVLVR